MQPGAGGDHHPPAHGIEKAPEEHRAEKISRRKRQKVPAHIVGANPIEVGEHQRIGKEDRIIEERLCRHQAQPDQGAPALGAKQRLGDLGQWCKPACAQTDRRQRSRRKALAARAKRALYLIEDRGGLSGATVGHQPARRLREPQPHEKDDQTECGADEEGKTPA